MLKVSKLGMPAADSARRMFLHKGVDFSCRRQIRRWGSVLVREDVKLASAYGSSPGNTS